MSRPLVGPNTRIVIMCWYMKGCGHCEEFKPRFRAQLQPYRDVFARRGVQILELDAAAPDLQGLADEFKVTGTPLTIAAARSGGQIRIEGAGSDRQIRDLLAAVAEA